ncbi:hypothetical protein ACIQ4I_00030 [Rummeliibacillus sp. NPDC094406]|uniref:hypothetical protein n=1 Tax=Rummeliibacillus sp. NPDC094406 TaxID=3364511 RepID=UPI00380C41C2
MNEAELRDLKIGKIYKRDFFQCELQKNTMNYLEGCNKDFEEFTSKVYRIEGISEENKE